MHSIKKALCILKNGGVVAHITDTCYGLACDMTNPKAVTKLFEIKHRPINMPVSALFASLEEAKKYVEWNDMAEKLAEKYLPGPLTLILPLKKPLPHPIFTTPLLTTHYQLLSAFASPLIQLQSVWHRILVNLFQQPPPTFMEVPIPTP